MTFDFTKGSDVFTGATKSVLSSASIALGDRLSALIGQGVSRTHGGIVGSISKATGGGVIGNILGTSIGNEIGGRLYSIAGSAVGTYAGTLGRAFSQIFTATDKMYGVSGTGFNIPNLINTTLTASGDLLASTLSQTLMLAGISPGSAAGIALGSGLTGMFHSGEKEIDPFSINRLPFKNPEELIDQHKATIGGGRNLIFPRDLPNYFMSFDFGTYRKAGPFAPGAVQKEGDRIFLPIPPQLQEDYNLQWSDLSRGIFGAVTPDNANKVLDAVKDLGAAGLDLVGLDQLYSDQSGMARQKGIKAIQDSLKAAGKMGDYITRQLASQVPVFGEKLGGSLDVAFGTIPNPHLAVLFGGVSFKTHQFSWRLVPNNKEESELIRDIIKVFKVNASPVRDGLFLHFPSVVFITICVEGVSSSLDGYKAPYLYAIKPCVIDGISVNYAPSGHPSFHAGGAPTAVDLAIKFREIELWYRDEMETTTGNAKAPYQEKGSVLGNVIKNIGEDLF